MIYVPKRIINLLKQHAQSELPNEACGYLGGKGNRVHVFQPLTNLNHSPSHFSMDPEEQFEFVKKIREAGFGPIAVYHSHPLKSACLSKKDKCFLKDPDMVFIIYSVIADEIKAYKFLNEFQYLDIAVNIIE